MAASLHHQPDSSESCIVLESELTHSLVAKLPQHSWLVVHEFPAAEEHCEQGYGPTGVSETLTLSRNRTEW